MTTNNYTHEEIQKYKQIILNIMQQNPNYYRYEIKKLHPEVYEFIENKNQVIQNYNFQTKLYWVLHDLSDFPRCQNSLCNKPLTKPIVKICKGYPKCCCNDCSNKSQAKRELIKNTTTKRWGGIGFASKELNEKERKIFFEKYDSEDPGNLPEFREKAKNTSLEHWGVVHPMHSDIVKHKQKQTMIKNHGVEYYSQSYEFHKNKRHKFHSEKYPGITFDSTWEVKVYEFCKDNNIDVEYSPKIIYQYEYNGEIHTYHPDFLINGKVYEVKGEHFFTINENGEEKMCCPFRSKGLTDMEYKYCCEIAEAKHQCMLNNNVIILRRKHIYNLSIDMFIP